MIKCQMNLQGGKREMNELKVLIRQEVLGKQFRVYGTAEEPLFVAIMM